MATRDENHFFTRRIAERDSDEIVFYSQDHKIQETDPKDVIWDEIIGKEEHPGDSDGYNFQETDSKAFIRDGNFGKEEYLDNCSTLYLAAPCFDEYRDKDWYFWFRYDDSAYEKKMDENNYMLVRRAHNRDTFIEDEEDVDDHGYAKAFSVLKKYPEIILAYSLTDEYHFDLKKKLMFLQRRASKIPLLIVSFFTSLYVPNWKMFFQQMDMRFISFISRVIRCPLVKVIQAYLAWKQRERQKKIYNTCFWMLTKSEKSGREAREILKGTRRLENDEDYLWVLKNLNGVVITMGFATVVGGGEKQTNVPFDPGGWVLRAIKLESFFEEEENNAVA